MTSKKRSVLAAVSVSFALVALARGGDPTTPLNDRFQAPLDATKWATLRFGDTKSDRIEASGGRLAIALETLGTDDSTVKLRGICSRNSFDISKGGLKAETTVDWNAQSNGCYLSAGLSFVDASFDGDPRQASESVTFEWVGVPPGKNVRPYLTRHKKGALVELYTEGWPQPKVEDRTGRAPKKSKVGVEVGEKLVRLTEDGKELWKGTDGLSGKVKLVLFVTGHSNYGVRTVYFGEVTVTQSGS
jgi:hypothetical protein